MLPPIDPVHIRDELTRIGERLREAQDDTAQATAADPRGLTEALADALDALQCRARNAASGGASAPSTSSSSQLPARRDA